MKTKHNLVAVTILTKKGRKNSRRWLCKWWFLKQVSHFHTHQSLADQITQHHTHVLHIRDFLDESDISHKTGYQPTRDCKVYLIKIIQA